jgi:hypothetical protein
MSQQDDTCDVYVLIRLSEACNDMILVMLMINAVPFSYVIGVFTDYDRNKISFIIKYHVLNLYIKQKGNGSYMQKSAL